MLFPANNTYLAEAELGQPQIILRMRQLRPECPSRNRPVGLGFGCELAFAVFEIIVPLASPHHVFTQHSFNVARSHRWRNTSSAMRSFPCRLPGGQSRAAQPPGGGVENKGRIRLESCVRTTRTIAAAGPGWSSPSCGMFEPATTSVGLRPFSSA